MKTYTYIYIEKDYPEVLMLNINWFSDQTTYMENFYFSISVSLSFNINEMFEQSPKDKKLAKDKKTLKENEFKEGDY